MDSCCRKTVAVHLNCPPCYAFGDRHFLAAMTTGSGASYCYWVVQKLTLTLVNCAHKQRSQCSCSCVDTLVILRAKFHVVSNLLSVLKIVIMMLSLMIALMPSTPIETEFDWNENTVNLSASFVVFTRRFDSYIHNKSLGCILARVC